MPIVKPNLIADQLLQDFFTTLGGTERLSPLAFSYLSQASKGPFNHVGFFVFFAPGGSQPSANTVAGVRVRRQVAAKAAGDLGEYVTLPDLPDYTFAEFNTLNTVLSGAHSGGQNPITVVSGTGAAVNQIICINHASGSRQFYEVRAVSGTSITLDRGLDTSQSDAATCKRWQGIYLPVMVGSRIAERISIENLDSDVNRDATVRVKWAAVEGTILS